MTSYLVSGISSGPTTHRPLSTRDQTELLQTSTRHCHSPASKIPFILTVKSGLLSKTTCPGSRLTYSYLVPHPPPLCVSVLLHTLCFSFSSELGSSSFGAFAHGTAFAWNILPYSISWLISPLTSGLSKNGTSSKSPSQMPHCWKGPPAILPSTLFFSSMVLFTCLYLYIPP